MLITWIGHAQNSEHREVSTFSKISVSDGIEVIYTDGAVVPIIVQGAEGQSLEDISTTVKNHTLTISRSKSGFPATVLVTAPALKKIWVSDNSKFRVKNKMSAAKVSLSLSSGAYFQGSISADKLWLFASSGTEINLRGSVFLLKANFINGARANISGEASHVQIYTEDGALCDARNLLTNNMRINANGHSTVLINGTGTSSLTASGEAIIKNNRKKAGSASTIPYRGKALAAKQPVSSNPEK